VACDSGGALWTKQQCPVPQSARSVAIFPQEKRCGESVRSRMRPRAQDKRIDGSSHLDPRENNKPEAKAQAADNKRGAP